MGWLRNEMRRHRHECLDCGSPTVPYTYPEARGRAGHVEFVLREVPVLRCSADLSHRMYMMNMNFDADLADAFQTSELEMARAGGFHSVCCFCNSSLDKPGPERITTRAVVDTGKHGTVDVEITGPAVTCEACGRAQVYNSYDPDADLNMAYSECFYGMPLIPY